MQFLRWVPRSIGTGRNVDTRRGFRDARAGGYCPSRSPTMNQKLTHPGLMEIALNTQRRPGNPLLFRMCAPFCAPTDPRVFLGPQQIFSGRHGRPLFLSPKLLTPASERIWHGQTSKLQFTKRRKRTLFTSPSIRNIDNMLEPPA